MSKVIRIWLACLVVILSVNVVVPTVHAQDGGAAAAAEGPAAAQSSKPGFIGIVFRNGAVNLLIWLLIFLTSFATIAFIVDGFLKTNRDKLLPTSVVDGVRDSLDEGDLDGAIGICTHNPGALSNILMAGFANIAEGYDVIQDAVTAATDMENERLLQGISYLNLCGQVAPMLGLLGTVTGMVDAFATLGDSAGAAKATGLALAISTALWTTVCGLLISVPALIAYTLFKNFATRLLLESEATVLDLIKILRNAEVDAEGAEEDTEEGY